jgi:hypothetical protein
MQASESSTTIWRTAMPGISVSNTNAQNGQSYDDIGTENARIRDDQNLSNGEKITQLDNNREKKEITDSGRQMNTEIVKGYIPK